jgi:hypothetical protein
MIFSNLRWRDKLWLELSGISADKRSKRFRSGVELVFLFESVQDFEDCRAGALVFFEKNNVAVRIARSRRFFGRDFQVEKKFFFRFLKFVKNQEKLLNKKRSLNRRRIENNIFN